jgi:hypothetical protein
MSKEELAEISAETKEELAEIFADTKEELAEISGCVCSSSLATPCSKLAKEKGQNENI